MIKMPVTSHGTHQLGLRCKSAKVLLGAMKTFTSRCGPERPGPAGSGAVGGTGAECMGGGGGVGPVGELINHPTLEFVESYVDFQSFIFWRWSLARHKSGPLGEMFPSPLRQHPDFAIVTQNLYC